MIDNNAYSDWQSWFAWYPVYVDAYRIDEIENGHMRFKKCCQWLEYRIHIWTDLGDGETHVVWQYRLPRRE